MFFRVIWGIRILILTTGNECRDLGVRKYLIRSVILCI